MVKELEQALRELEKLHHWVAQQRSSLARLTEREAQVTGKQPTKPPAEPGAGTQGKTLQKK